MEGSRKRIGRLSLSCSHFSWWGENPAIYRDRNERLQWFCLNHCNGSVWAIITVQVEPSQLLNTTVQRTCPLGGVATSGQACVCPHPLQMWSGRVAARPNPKRGLDHVQAARSRDPTEFNPHAQAHQRQCGARTRQVATSVWAWFPSNTCENSKYPKDTLLAPNFSYWNHSTVITTSHLRIKSFHSFLSHLALILS